MKLKKVLPAIFITSIFLFSPVYAADKAEKKSSDDGIIENLKNTIGAVKDKAVEVGTAIGEKATEIGSAIGDKVHAIGESISDAVTSTTSKRCVGTWLFSNGKYSTQIVCEENGNMTITQDNFSGNNVYSGTYTATTNKITFNVTKKSSRVLFVTTSKNMEETWSINYALTSTPELKVSSDDIPNDANGYDFSTTTIFKSGK